MSIKPILSYDEFVSAFGLPNLMEAKSEEKDKNKKISLWMFNVIF